MSTYTYKGQEKIKVTEGEFEGVFGYVRRAHSDGRLYVILDNGRKISINETFVEFVHPNYFLVGIEDFKKTMNK